MTSNKLSNTTFMACQLMYATRTLDNRGFLTPETVEILQQTIKNRKWSALWYLLNSLEGITLKIDGNNPLTSGSTEIMITVDKVARANALNSIALIKKGINRKQNSVCRSIW